MPRILARRAWALGKANNGKNKSLLDWSSAAVGVPNRLIWTFAAARRFTVERGQTPCERIDKRVEVVIVQRAVHPAIALGDISIEIVAAEHDLKCARAADQAREPFQRSAARDQSDADLGVAE